MKAFVRLRAKVLGALHDEGGGALLEFAIALPLFLLLLIGLLSFGRVWYSIGMAEAAMHRAARIAVVRPPACPGLTVWNAALNKDVRITVARGNASATPLPSFGTSCASLTGLCTAPTVTCNGDASYTTAAEIWNAVAPLLPAGTTIANLSFRYDFDPALNFLGGPYVPRVTVAVTVPGTSFSLFSVFRLAQFYTGQAPSASGGYTFPTLSASLPGEDLGQGNGN